MSVITGPADTAPDCQRRHWLRRGGEIIRCLNAATGKEIWKNKYDADESPAGLS